MSENSSHGPASRDAGAGSGPSAPAEHRTPYEADLERADQCLREGRTEEAARIVEGMPGKLPSLCEAARRSDAPGEYLARVLGRLENLLQRCVALRQRTEAELRALRLQEGYDRESGNEPGGSWVSERV